MQVAEQELAGREIELTDEEMDSAIESAPAELKNTEEDQLVGIETPDIVRERILDVKQVIDESYLELGRLLYRVLNSKLYLGWGYSAFAPYVVGELGFQERKAQYFIALWKKLKVELGLDDAEVRGIGWTKLKELKPLLTEANAHQMLDVVKTGGKDGGCMSVREVQDFVKETRGDTGDDGDADGDTDVDDSTSVGASVDEDLPTKTFSVRLFKDQHKTVTDAVELAKQVYQSDKLCYVVSSIFLEWQASHLEGADSDRLAYFMKQLEETFGVRVFAFDKAQQKIVERILAGLSEQAPSEG